MWPAQLGVRPAVQLVQLAVQLDVQLDVELVQLALHLAVRLAAEDVSAAHDGSNSNNLHLEELSFCRYCSRGILPCCLEPLHANRDGEIRSHLFQHFSHRFHCVEQSPPPGSQAAVLPDPDLALRVGGVEEDSTNLTERATEESFQQRAIRKAC